MKKIDSVQIRYQLQAYMGTEMEPWQRHRCGAWHTVGGHGFGGTSDLFFIYLLFFPK